MEIALFKVKKEAINHFKELNEKMSQTLSTYGGYISSKTYRGTDHDSVFIDIVWWESLEKAKEAETKFRTDDALKDYRDALGRVMYYDHINLSIMENYLLIHIKKNPPQLSLVSSS